MEFKKIESGVLKTARDYSEKYGIEADADFAMHKLYEEVGELSEAYLTYKKKSRPEKFTTEAEVKNKLAYELADVAGIVMVIAEKLNIDLEDAINRKWIIKEWERKK
ncbi:MAG: MazG nucleotide pyrophosphohydrolase domain-containing protein [Candidatus Moranbacteria bacterium]|nr:MazG nucleotide pyrophosphohydrolase domain-containing protein [Candidatus Moranbacteria bacterium]